MAANVITGHLYIADRDGQCLWQVDVNGYQDSGKKKKVKAEKLLRVQHYPWSFSVAETGQVFVVGLGGCELAIRSSQDEQSEVNKLEETGLTDIRH